MAATYIELAIQMEFGKERGRETSEPDPQFNGAVRGLVGIEGNATARSADNRHGHRRFSG
jgi:hypothetical protein